MCPIARAPLKPNPLPITSLKVILIYIPMRSAEKTGLTCFLIGRVNNLTAIPIGFHNTATERLNSGMML